MKAAIAIDSWKLTIFTRHLHEKGFSYEQKPGATKDDYLLIVETDKPQELGQLVLKANMEAARSKKK